MSQGAKGDGSSGWTNLILDGLQAKGDGSSGCEPRGTVHPVEQSDTGRFVLQSVLFMRLIRGRNIDER